MPAKKNTYEFIEDAIKVHGKKYNYSKVNYKNSSSNVIIICPQHGEFIKTPQKHLSGQGCRVCSGKVILNQVSFLERAKKKHNDVYDYSITRIKSKKDKVEIVCKKHGIFKQLPFGHLRGSGCPICAQTSRAVSQQYSLEEFIGSIAKTHNNKYDYSEVEYVNSKTKIKIICPKHGFFLMRPNSHFNGQGCPTCGKLSAKENIALDYPEFLERAARVHEGQYQYVENSYKNYTTKMKIFCSKHGFFEQTPHSHISMNSGCPKCGTIKASMSNQKGLKVVLNMFKSIHGNRYKYDESTYKNVTTKMQIMCQRHGWFEQKPYHHYGGAGCNDCAIEGVHEKQKIDFKEFIARSIETHGARYNYIKADFIDIFTPVKISCKTHGDFFQKPRNHYRGAGCPKCQSSRGENIIRLILEELNILSEEQKTFDDLIYKGRLRCDFYLPNHNVVIEYNGLQHYEPVSIFGGTEALRQTQKRDLAKYKYLIEKGIQIVIVRYDNENIRNYLIDKLGLA
jgi:Zn finger protein HypA/HybF involved in hydrogenase expression